ncbi:MAG: hypothetical protein K0U11_06790 [Gammaproteobacteria bacterium]|nr:hypothetical protein [Gammaproteobacteria bacterium]
MQAAYYALHYGREYLAHSIRSIQDAVDEVHVFYVDRPSYGHTQGAKCPDTRDELHAEAQRFAEKPLHWHDCGGFRNEGEHRAHAVNTLQRRGAHQILVVDADEVWIPGAAKLAIDEATRANCRRNWLAHFVHFIRSTKYAVTDHFTPVRVLDLRHAGGDGVLSKHVPPVLHFGYAQRDAIIKYKWTCHGHQRELRPDWMARFLSWTPDTTDLHPVIVDFWKKAQPLGLDLAQDVGVALDGHPYLELDVIR